jgi:hypothetical protein
MTLRADRTTDDAEPPGLTPDVADDLADMLRRGRTVGGQVVSRVVFRLADGRRVSADLPAPRADSQDDRAESTQASRPKLSQTARDILEVLEDREGEWVPLSEVAAAMPGQPDHTSGTFTRATTELRKAGLVDSSKQHGYRLRNQSN